MRGGWRHDAEGQSVDWRLLGRLWPFVRPHRRAFAGGLALMALASGLQLVGPYLLKLAIDGPIARRDPSGLATYAALYLGAVVVGGGLTALHTLLVRTRGQEILLALRSRLFRKALRLPVSHFDRTSTGSVLARVTSDVAVLTDLFSSGVAALLGDVLLLVGILVVMLEMNARLAGVALFLLPVLGILSELFRRRMRVAYRATREKTAVLSGRLQEFVRGFEVLRLFGAEPWAEAEFDRVNGEHRDAFVRSATLYALFFPSVELVGSLAVAGLLWVGGGATLRGEVTFGELVAFLEYLQKFFRPVRDMSEKFNVLQASMAAIERITQFLDAPEEQPTGTARPAPVEGPVAFTGVCASYDGQTPVLREVDLSVAPGEVVALVGPTGAGKTTLAHLLLGFYRQTAGEVRVGGRDLRELDRDYLRGHMALVAQDVFLFHGTVLDNIRLGRPQVSAARARDAARAVGLHEAVAAMPAGYDTPVLEGGVRLSAGQRQLVSFARALAGDPRILILDEATSEVDQATEGAIERALATLLDGRTCLVIAHRLTTVRRAHRVVVLARGRVVEEGSHEDLLRGGGLYRSLYELQFRRLGGCHV